MILPKGQNPRLTYFEVNSIIKFTIQTTSHRKELYSTLGATRPKMTISATTQSDSQYSLAKIIGILATAALPMPLLAFFVAPALSSRVEMHPGIVLWLLMIAGMIWQFVVSLWLIYHDLGTLKWPAVRERVWLNKPRDPKTGETKASLFWWLVPAFLLVPLIEFSLDGFLSSVVAKLFPFVASLPVVELDQLASPEFIGAWWLVGIALVSNIF
ncbi:MAG: hypothetical protein GY796_25525, partial [Chloroflexi bacterium]|nr:hypothetical protein [Chloroflexota bacterium]